MFVFLQLFVPHVWKDFLHDFWCRYVWNIFSTAHLEYQLPTSIANSFFGEGQVHDPHLVKNLNHDDFIALFCLQDIAVYLWHFETTKQEITHRIQLESDDEPTVSPFAFGFFGNLWIFIVDISGYAHPEPPHRPRFSMGILKMMRGKKSQRIQMYDWYDCLGRFRVFGCI